MLCMCFIHAWEIISGRSWEKKLSSPLFIKKLENRVRTNKGERERSKINNKCCYEKNNGGDNVECWWAHFKGEIASHKRLIKVFSLSVLLFNDTEVFFHKHLHSVPSQQFTIVINKIWPLDDKKLQNKSYLSHSKKIAVSEYSQPWSNDHISLKASTVHKIIYPIYISLSSHSLAVMATR